MTDAIAELQKLVDEFKRGEEFCLAKTRFLPEGGWSDPRWAGQAYGYCEARIITEHAIRELKEKAVFDRLRR